MSVTDDLAARLAASVGAAAEDTSLMAEFIRDPNNPTLREIDARLRANAHNAQLDAMAAVGRTRFTDEDARLANVMYMSMMSTRPADTEAGLVPNAQVKTAKTTAKLQDTFVQQQPPKGGESDGQEHTETGQAGLAA